MKIAVCDDDKNCLDSIKRLLAEYPGISRIEYYQELSQLSEALENGTTYDLVLMDIEWEGNEQDGITYAAQYNVHSPQTWFIFVTAYNDKFSQKIFLGESKSLRFSGKTGQKGKSGKAIGKSQRKNIQQRCTDPAAWWDYRENCKQSDPVSGEQCTSIADTYDIRRNLGI